MHLVGTFKALDFHPTAIAPTPPIQTALPIGITTMRKTYAGEITGQSATLFIAAFDRVTGKGTYLAMEAFEGQLGPRSGTFAFVHSATTSGTDRTHEVFFIVPNSGTGDLAGLTGTGGMAIDADGTHRIWFDL
jgi:hypothetical protein